MRPAETRASTSRVRGQITRSSYGSLGVLDGSRVVAAPRSVRSVLACDSAVPTHWLDQRGMELTLGRAFPSACPTKSTRTRVEIEHGVRHRRQLLAPRSGWCPIEGPESGLWPTAAHGRQ